MLYGHTPTEYEQPLSPLVPTSAVSYIYRIEAPLALLEDADTEASCPPAMDHSFGWAIASLHPYGASAPRCLEGVLSTQIPAPTASTRPRSTPQRRPPSILPALSLRSMRLCHPIARGEQRYGSQTNFDPHVALKVTGTEPRCASPISLQCFGKAVAMPRHLVCSVPIDRAACIHVCFKAEDDLLS